MNQAPPSIQKVEKAIGDMIEDIQRTQLLPRQKEAFLCCARCCDGGSSIPQLEQCIQNCGQHSAASQKLIQRHLAEFQERFQRAAYHCQDVAKDAIPFDPNPAEQAKGQEKFNSCMEQSGKEFLDKVPKLRADIVAALKRL